jgi:protein-disulfide isomerase
MLRPGDRREPEDVSEILSGRVRSRRTLMWVLVAIAAFVIARQMGLFGPVVDTQSLATVDTGALVDELQSAGPLLGEGNPDGDAVLVEFFDYRCPHCRRMAPVVADLAENDGGLHVILVEYPVLGPESVLAAQYALAAARQGAYGPYHRALMFSAVPWTPEALADLGKSLGLDVAQLRQDAQSAEISALLAAYKAIGENAGVDGTPAYIAGDLMLVGAADELTLKEMVRQGREAAAAP